ncbi:MAG: SET domain-containing protein-lysine N-methyltransferase [Candidatus Eisenbacteria bacterium]|nr:SET domain-containing protein-lysine N-methyltransferase [Candidatus Eisenbacteria bacterium]
MHVDNESSGRGDRPVFREGMIPDYYISPAARPRQIAGKGLGVTAVASIEESEIIECAPVKLLTPNKGLDREWRRLHRVLLETVLGDYVFEWTTHRGAVALGYGGLYNHSSHSNATVIRLIRPRKIVFVAKRAIKPGEEITISYRHVWFQPVEQEEGRPDCGGEAR